MKKTFIRSIKLNDKEDWQELYQGYAEFYKVEMTKSILNTVWSWLIDEQHVINGLVCECEEKIVEIANMHCQGRVISFLEGGYDLIALSESIREHLDGLKEN